MKSLPCFPPGTSQLLRPRFRALCWRSFMLSVLVLIGYIICNFPRSKQSEGYASPGYTTSSSSILSVVIPKAQSLQRRPPLVNRSILDKLDSLDQSFGDEVQEDGWRIWPPKVTRIPSEDAQRRQTHSKGYRDLALDVELCNTSPCRILLPSFIGEQESKARRHFLQLSHLAQAINRTLVLPNVGKSRMSTCSKWDFGFYYETADLHGIVTFSAFRRWVALRGARPKAQVVEIFPTRSDSRDDASLITIDSSSISELEHVEVTIARSADPSRSAHNHCLQSRARNLHFGGFSSLHIHPRLDVGNSWDRNQEDASRFGQGVVEALSSSQIAEKAKRGRRNRASLLNNDADVLVVSWELRRAVFYPPPAAYALHYANRWAKMAQVLSDRLQPFLAIHWRMEGVPATSLSTCVPLLITTISSLLSQRVVAGEVTSVYLATDYPTEGLNRPHSSTFEVGEEHHSAMQLFEAAFMDTQNLQLTSLVKELENGRLVREDFRPDDLDSGLMGIIDKMVATQAAWFISGRRECGKVSSFTGQIIENRKQSKTSAMSKLLNVVDYFG